MAAPGPRPLGRGVVVGPGAEVPPPWAGVERVRVGPEELDAPGSVVDDLHAAWARRRPVVVELAADADALRAPEICGRPPYELRPDFEFRRERLHFLVWANNYDARQGRPVWWHGRKAARRWARGADAEPPGAPEPHPGATDAAAGDPEAGAAGAGDAGAGEAGAGDAGAGDLVLPSGAPAWIDGGPSTPPELPDGAVVLHRWSVEAGSRRPSSRSRPQAELAPDQLAAVAHDSGPARVIAPAGSGKTRVLTERLRHLVVDRGVDPAVVTAVAFNTRAADELRARCREVVGPGGPHIRTLNSLGLAICRAASPDGRLRVAEEPEVRALVERIFEVRHQANTDTVAPYLEALASVRLGLRSPEEAERVHPDAVGLAGGFARYRRALADAGAVDFDEQIYRAVEVLLTDPAGRAEAQRRCRHLLVDEFQDLNPGHLLLLRLLAAPGFDCFGVGDDDQVIYGYSGATPEYLIDYPTYFPGAAAYALEVNYRCPPAVVDAARHLLSYNRRRLPKTLVAASGSADGSGGGAALEVRTGPAPSLALDAVEVVRGWCASGVDPGDIAVLSRVNSALLPVQVACAEHGIPCRATLDARVLNRTGIRTALAYLRIGNDPGRIARSDLLDTVRRPSRRISRNVVDMLTRRATTSIADIRRLAGRLSGGDVDKLQAYADDLEAVAASMDSTAAALHAIRVDVGLGDALDVLDASRDQPDRSTHADDLLALESVAALHPDPAGFEPWLRRTLGRRDAERSGGDGEPAGPSVLLSTVHRIKGREWGHVLIHGASRGSFPHRLADDVEEERRVFHVALTRARHRLVVLADVDAPSPFVAELDGSGPRRADPEPARRGTRTDPGPPGSGPGRPRSAARAGGGRGPGVGGEAAPVEVVEALKVWRKAAAARENVPAYVILNDEHLTGVAARRPSTVTELAGCRGIGPTRLERYGDEILAVLDAVSVPGPS